MPVAETFFEKNHRFFILLSFRANSPLNCGDLPSPFFFSRKTEIQLNESWQYVVEMESGRS